MKTTIHLTLDWPYERVSKYGREITAAMKKIADRFPDDLAVSSMAEDIITGKNQLWLFLDEDEQFVAFVTSEIIVSELTGKKSVRLGELAGEGGLDLVPHIEAIEEWARSIGAVELTPFGREGWRKPLARAGYKPKFVLYSKDLTNG